MDTLAMVDEPHGDLTCAICSADKRYNDQLRTLLVLFTNISPEQTPIVLTIPGGQKRHARISTLVLVVPMEGLPDGSQSDLLGLRGAVEL